MDQIDSVQTPLGMVRILVGEIQLLMAVMRQNSRWTHFDNEQPGGTDSALWKEFKVSAVRVTPRIDTGWQVLRNRLSIIGSLEDLQPVIWLQPFLEACFMNVLHQHNQY